MIVLDTHALIWWATGDVTRLTPPALQALEHETGGGTIMVSSISAWELAMLVAKGRLTLQMDVSRWLSLVNQIEAVSFIPVDNEIAVSSTTLPDAFHKDPADRIIVATARKYAAPLVTADEKIRAYPHVHTIW
ncbi:twitching motility protein PilT [Betaproteobacteria bacterium]|nr:twitching motility protein PilT [Betaproteobacteria bacterium]GHU45144.1 twitching motility protein PilT [Betaproteobacteria bacterium]